MSIDNRREGQLSSDVAERIVNDVLAAPVPSDGGEDANAAPRSFLNLPADWDSYGADPIDERAVIAAERGLSYVPTRSGGVQIEFNAAGVGVEIEIAPDGESAVVLVDPASAPSDGGADGERTSFTEYVREIEEAASPEELEELERARAAVPGRSPAAAPVGGLAGLCDWVEGVVGPWPAMREEAHRIAARRSEEPDAARCSDDLRAMSPEELVGMAYALHRGDGSQTAALLDAAIQAFDREGAEGEPDGEREAYERAADLAGRALWEKRAAAHLRWADADAAEREKWTGYGRNLLDDLLKIVSAAPVRVEAEGERVTLERGRIGTWVSEWRVVREPRPEGDMGHHGDQLAKGERIVTERVEFQLAPASVPVGDAPDNRPSEVVQCACGEEWTRPVGSWMKCGCGRNIRPADPAPQEPAECDADETGRLCSGDSPDSC